MAKKGEGTRSGEGIVLFPDEVLELSPEREALMDSSKERRTLLLMVPMEMIAGTPIEYNTYKYTAARLSNI